MLPMEQHSVDACQHSSATVNGKISHAGEIMQHVNHEQGIGHREDAVQGEEMGTGVACQRMVLAEAAKLISTRFAYRRLLLSVGDRDPDPAVLEKLYEKHPNLRGSERIEPIRCSFCGGRADRIRSVMIEGNNAARICSNCAESIVESLAEASPE